MSFKQWPLNFSFSCLKKQFQMFRYTSRGRIFAQFLVYCLFLIIAIDAATRQANNPSVGTGICRWMTKREFQGVNLDNGEVIIRDSLDQPCYIIASRAFIRWNDTLYFPLRHFKVNQYAYRMIPIVNEGEHLGERLLLNCSMPNGSDGQVSNSITLLPAGGRTMQPFKEEIIITLDCGYLVIRTRIDNAKFSLETISFYQDPKLAPTFLASSSSSANDWSIKVNDTSAAGRGIPLLANGNAARLVSTKRKQPQQSVTGGKTKIITLMKPEHLVFSSQGTHQTPLLKMPLVSRYICQNRVELTGKNSIQLVLERFEIQRLTHQPPPVSRPQVQPQPRLQVSSQRQTQVQLQPQHPDHPTGIQEAPGVIQSQVYADPKSSLQNNHLARHKRLNEMTNTTGAGNVAPQLIKTSSSSPNNQQSNHKLQTGRHTRDTTILYKSPLVSVTTCANPATPTSPLYSMMDSSNIRSYDILEANTADKSTASTSSTKSAATQITKIDFGFRASNNCLLNYVLTLYLVNYIMRRCFQAN